VPASKQRHPAYRGASALYSERESLYQMNAVSGADVGKPRDSFRHIRAVTFGDIYGSGSTSDKISNSSSSSSVSSRRSAHLQNATDEESDRKEAEAEAEAETETETTTTRASMTISNDAVRASTSTGRSRSLKGSVFSEELNSLFSSSRRPSGKPSTNPNA
jgi:hypothetical protein